METSIDILTERAEEAARMAGTEIMRTYGTADITRKDDGSPVTDADMRAHHAIVSVLAKTNIPIFSEEAPRPPLPYPPYLWIIDPLDGTKGFIAGTDDFCVMIALIHNGKPVLSVIYIPVSDTLYTARKGSGVQCVHGTASSARILNTNTGDPLRMIRSVNHVSPAMHAVAEKLGATVIPRGSVGVKAQYIVENEGDFFFSLGSFSEWDTCAPQLLVEEAGGIVRDGNGMPILYGTPAGKSFGTIFSHLHCYDTVFNAVSEVKTERN